MLKEYKARIDSAIKNYFSALPDNTLTDAMAYSMNLGGKRLRPALVIMSAGIFGLQEEAVMNMALAMEMIHTYSLIHDDLPAMDDDDFRRGWPTSHKVYGEGGAVLAGDAMLNEAFTLLLSEYAVTGRNGARAALIISRAAGREGMILGQVHDLENEKKKADYASLLSCHEKKTGELIAASLCGPAVLAGASEEEVGMMRSFGIKLGLAFQIQDDILDAVSTKEVLGKSAGKDERSGKTTYVELFGIEKSREMAEDVTNECIVMLKSIRRDTEVLEAVTRQLLTRTY